ncbi:MAG: GH3 auxin-responsive promoter family protein [Bacteroidota bacterium]
MGIRSLLSKPLAAYINYYQKKWSTQPASTQNKLLQRLIKKGSTTTFGIDHHFNDIKNYNDFKKAVPIRDYEALKPYVEKIIAGENSVLWPGKPAYFAKTSGTTSGTKYIPITSDSIPNHINSARNALLNYIHETGKSQFLDKKLIFLSGSPILSKTGDILTGRLSGMVNHHVPAYLRANQMPSYATNCIEDWEMKLDKVIEETLQQPMSLISGIPPWVQMYFDRIQDKTGKKIKEVFPEFSLFVYGGVNFEPYKEKLFDSVGKKIDSIETYPASEGFIAYQDTQTEAGLLLLLNSGIFFEFIPAENFFDENPPRLKIDEVEIDKNYALIINSNAGLWGYSIGDTIKFVSKKPYRLIVTGRIKHFISAFGEHVIGEEVEKALQYAQKKSPQTKITEFSVAPKVKVNEGLPYHEWLIAFGNEPENMTQFANDIDNKLCELNSYYDDLISGNILKPLVITPLQKDAFQNYMKSIGKLGGQNKVPRLANDRTIADVIIQWKKY